MPGFSLRPSSSISGSTRPEIPLQAIPEIDTTSIGSLVKDASEQVSTLVRSEIELAKLEITQSVKTGLKGAIFFIGAAVIGLVSLIFVWFVLAEVIAIWLPHWAAYLIVLGLMVLMIGLLVFLGVKKIKQVKKPEKTIETLSQTASTLKAAASSSGPTTR